MTNEAATQVLLWMRQDYRCPGLRMPENIVEAGDALQNPALAFKTALNVTAVGKHWPLISEWAGANSVGLDT